MTDFPLVLSWKTNADDILCWGCLYFAEVLPNYADLMPDDSPADDDYAAFLAHGPGYTDTDTTS